MLKVRNSIMSVFFSLYFYLFWWKTLLPCYQFLNSLIFIFHMHIYFSVCFKRIRFLKIIFFQFSCILVA